MSTMDAEHQRRAGRAARPLSRCWRELPAVINALWPPGDGPLGHELEREAMDEIDIRDLTMPK